MSGNCQLCGEHCLDCKCGKQNLGCDSPGTKFNDKLGPLPERMPIPDWEELEKKGFKFTGYAVKMKLCIICIVPEHKDMKDMVEEEVNHPGHYQGKTFEAIDVIEDWKLNFNLGNAIKYILRCHKKGCKNKDLEKAVWYLQREINNE